MNETAKSHVLAKQAINWLKDYYKSMRHWIKALDANFGQLLWYPTEPNRVSKKLGAGYITSTGFLVSWIWRHYWQQNSNETLIMVLNYDYEYPKDVCPVVLFARLKHKSLPTNMKKGGDAEVKATAKAVEKQLDPDWSSSRLLIEKALQVPSRTVIHCPQAEERKGFFEHAEDCSYLCVPLDQFGNDGALTQEVIEDVLAKLWPARTKSAASQTKALL